MLRFRNAWGALGAMLGLVALYLVLAHGTQAAQLIRAGGGSLADVFRTLQARDS